jgi:DNA replication protein DnaC
MNEYRWVTEGLSENAIDAIALEHGLFVGPGGKELVGESLADKRAPLAEIDIAFAKLNPDLPIENVCSRLDNYKPKNESQEALVGMANKLVGYMSPSRLAGFIACGAAGLGKTHVAVGAAKASLMTGQKTFYVNVPSRSSYASGIEAQANAADIVIIDDLNSPYGVEFDASRTRKLLGAMHNKGGGKLMITSNAPNIQAFLNQILLPSDPIERVRIQDRVSSALLGLEITGESYRSQSAVGQKRWWEE